MNTAEKILIYSLTIGRKNPTVHGIKLSNIPDKLKLRDIKPTELKALLEALAGQVMHEHVDFMSVDTNNLSISTQCFFDFTKDADIKILRLVDQNDPSTYVIKLLGDEMVAMDFSSLILV